jgi:hypothetical protein
MEEIERKKRLRSERFKDHLTNPGGDVDTDTTLSFNPLPSPKRMNGLSTKIERPYLRLTSAPQPSMVRPLNVLKLALENVKQKYLENGDYSYACEQLKSIRQGPYLLTSEGSCSPRFNCSKYS